MPEEGVSLTPDSKLMTSSEIVRVVKLFAGMGTEKVRLTGGEPLVRRDLVDIVGEEVGVGEERRERRGRRRRRRKRRRKRRRRRRRRERERERRGRRRGRRRKRDRDGSTHRKRASCEEGPGGYRR